MTEPRVTATPGQTVGPFFHYALPYDGDSELVPPGTRRGAAARHGADGAGERCPTPSSSSGRPTPDGQVVQQPARCTATATPSPAGAGRRWTSRATTPSPRVNPGPPPRDGKAPFISLFRSCCGLLELACSHALDLAEDTEAPWPRIPLLASLPEEPPRRTPLVAERVEAERRPALRHPAAGRRRDGLPALRETQTNMNTADNADFGQAVPDAWLDSSRPVYPAIPQFIPGHARRRNGPRLARRGRRLRRRRGAAVEAGGFGGARTITPPALPRGPRRRQTWSFLLLADLRAAIKHSGRRRPQQRRPQRCTRAPPARTSSTAPCC